MIQPELEVLDGETGSSALKKGATLKGDVANVCLLMFLYLLQGIPLGLGEAIPMILQSKGVSYNDQAMYSITAWPFSIKLLWAPVVDAVYSKRFGRRKSWLVPAQFLIGIFMLGLSSRADSWLEDPAGPRVVLLTVYFFILTFLAATQDIALDGWCLTMLRRENIGYASTCGTVGQTAGYFISYFIFMALESADFCNAYLRSEPLPYGVITLSSFLNYFGWVFLTTTALIWMLKREILLPDGEPVLGVLETYKQLLRIMRLPAMKTYAVFLLTMTIGFSACDSISWLKLVRDGLAREKFAMVTTTLIPINISLLLLLSKRLTGETAMDVFMKIYPVRLCLNLVVAVFIWGAPYMILGQEIPFYFYGLFIIIYGCLQMASYLMRVARGAFYARVSDPAVGGTYMTLLNTLSNVSLAWPNSLVLLLMEPLTFKRCSTCSTTEFTEDCVDQCETQVDGYYVLTALCTMFGILWLWWAIPTGRDLQSKDPQAWKVQSQCQKKLKQSPLLQTHQPSEDTIA